MNETTRSSNNYVGYEYMEVTVSRNMEQIYTDNYQNFGWILEGTSLSVTGLLSVNLKFKRDRKIMNKAELTRLQRQFDSKVKEIEKLEASKTVGASTAAYIMGIAGTAFMAASVFSFLAEMIPLCIILAVPAFVGWVIPYFCYKRIQANKTAQVTPLIDQQYDTIYEVCEKANAALIR